MNYFGIPRGYSDDCRLAVVASLNDVIHDFVIILSDNDNRSIVENLDVKFRNFFHLKIPVKHPVVLYFVSDPVVLDLVGLFFLFFGIPSVFLKEF